MEYKTTFGVGSTRLARLLSLAMDEDKQQRKRESPRSGEILKDRLGGAVQTDAMIETIDELKKELESIQGRSLCELLLDGDTGLDTFVAVKDYYKKAALDGDAAGHGAAVVIYYTAIASALAFHDQKITTHSYADLAKYFDMLLLNDWLPPEIASHLSTAARRSSKVASVEREGGLT